MYTTHPHIQENCKNYQPGKILENTVLAKQHISVIDCTCDLCRSITWSGGSRKPYWPVSLNSMVNPAARNPLLFLLASSLQNLTQNGSTLLYKNHSMLLHDQFAKCHGTQQLSPSTTVIFDFFLLRACRQVKILQPILGEFKGQ